MSFTSGRCLFVVSDRMEPANGRALMPEIEPTVELHEGFSEPDATAPPWAEVVEVLSRSEMFWLSTVRRDGRPHVTPLPAIWLDGTLHFCAGAAEQKAKNLESNPHCILTTGTNQLRSGLDVVVEGAAARVTENAQLQRLAAIARLGFRGRRRGVPRSRRSPGTRLRRHTDEDPLVRQSPLQPDPLHLLRPERPTWGKGLTRRAAVHRGLAQRTCNRSPLGGHFLCMRAESGETEARARFEGLFAGHYGELLRFAQRRVGIDAAGDVVAETFLIAWRRLPEVPVEHARAWLYMTARHVIANELRARQRRDRLGEHTRDDIATDRAVAGDHATLIAEQIRVRAVLESLSQMDQEVLRLTEWEQLDLTEAAAALGCSRTAAKVRLHRARRRFARRLAAADSSPNPEGDQRPAALPLPRPEAR